MWRLKHREERRDRAQTTEYRPEDASRISFHDDTVQERDIVQELEVRTSAHKRKIRRRFIGQPVYEQRPSALTLPRCLSSRHLCTSYQGACCSLRINISVSRSAFRNESGLTPFTLQLAAVLARIAAERPPALALALRAAALTAVPLPLVWRRVRCALVRPLAWKERRLCVHPRIWHETGGARLVERHRIPGVWVLRIWCGRRLRLRLRLRVNARRGGGDGGCGRGRGRRLAGVGRRPRDGLALSAVGRPCIGVSVVLHQV